MEKIFVGSCGRKPLQNLRDFGSIARVIVRELSIVSQPIRLGERFGFRNSGECPVKTRLRITD